MNHWIDGLRPWQKRWILYTSPAYYIGWVLIAISYLFMVLFCLLTDSTTPQRRER